MRAKTLALPLVAALVVGLGACDLDVENINEPNRNQALASGDDVEALIAGSYSSYWAGAHYWDGPMAMQVAGDHMSASWGNWGMNDIGKQPALAVENTSNYTYRDFFEDPWENWYAGVSAASDGLRAMDGGIAIGPGGERNARARAFAKFNQGLSGCMLAALYDQAFTVDETTDFEDIPLVPYDEMMSFYVGKLSEAAQIASSNSFTLPAQGWLGKVPLTNTEFAGLARSYMARCKTIGARSPAERAALDWAGIIADVDAGLNELVLPNTDASAEVWWDGMKGLFPEPATWGRAHLDWVGLSDQSGNYQAWLNTPFNQRTPFLITTPDERMPPENTAGSEGMYLDFQPTCCPFPADRGPYRNSNYSDLRYRAYQSSCSFCWFGDIDEMLPVEMDLIKAEGLIRTGDVAGGAAIINQTRVGNGGLTAVAGAGPVPNEPGGGCVPRKRFDPAGTCGDLMNALQYEHYMEINIVYLGDTYFFARGHGELFPGRPLHLAIPAKELETLQMDIYTFGGDPGAPGSAPPLPSVSNLRDPDFALRRVSYSLDAIRERRAAQQRELKVVREH